RWQSQHVGALSAVVHESQSDGALAIGAGSGIVSDASPSAILSTADLTMSTQSYRLTVVVCAASWFLVGLHAPIVHHIMRHGASPSMGALVGMVIFTLTGVVALLALLRRRAPG
ncbi:MAG: hypothetical protein ABIP93_00005, partial [Gemmatimonadaceae bacterium]